MRNSIYIILFWIEGSSAENVHILGIWFDKTKALKDLKFNLMRDYRLNINENIILHDNKYMYKNTVFELIEEEIK